MAAALGDGRYRLGEVIGAGGMATVYRGTDERLHRDVAVKILADNLSADPAFRARFTQEARLAARLSHRNVVQVFDVGEEGGRPYIVMELVQGTTLADELARRGRLPADEVRDVAVQVCAGLQSAHAAGLVHRDVKPGNLLRADDGTIKIADFGIARAADATRITRVGDMVGTAAYVAPEQAAGQPGTPATDLYQLGVVLTELATGQHPGTAGSGGVVVVGDPQLEAIIRRCLAPDPADRPPSAAAVAAALRATASDAATVQTPTGDTQIMPAPTERRPTRPAGLPKGLVPAAAVAALIVLIAVLAALRGSDGRGEHAISTTTVPATSTVPPTTAPPPTNAARAGCSADAVDFSGRILVRQKFQNRDLRCSNFSGANLAGVDFRNADLRNVSFRGSNLVSVDFRNADLRGADLRGANTLGVRWKNATCPDGTDADEEDGCEAG